MLVFSLDPLLVEEVAKVASVPINFVGSIIRQKNCSLLILVAHFYDGEGMSQRNWDIGLQLSCIIHTMAIPF